MLVAATAIFALAHCDARIEVLATADGGAALSSADAAIDHDGSMIIPITAGPGSCAATTDVEFVDVAGAPPAVPMTSTVPPGVYALRKVEFYPTDNGGPNASVWSGGHLRMLVSFTSSGEFALVWCDGTKEFQRANGTYTITDGKITSHLTSSAFGPPDEEQPFFADNPFRVDAEGIVVRGPYWNDDGATTTADEHYVTQ
jgi:hypothetical protein